MIEAIRLASEAMQGTEAQKLRAAATDFEALLLAQLFKAMRQERGWMGTGEDEASASMLEIAEEHLAAVLAAGGGLGLAALVAEGLERDQLCAGQSGGRTLGQQR